MTMHLLELEFFPLDMSHQHRSKIVVLSIGVVNIDLYLMELPLAVVNKCDLCYLTLNNLVRYLQLHLNIY